MKKLLSVFAAAAMLFGFASCSGDLHDVSYVAPVKYVMGDITNGSPAEMTVDGMTSTYKFTYAGSMTAWGGGAGAVNFKVAPNADAGGLVWTEAWSDAKVTLNGPATTSSVLNAGNITCSDLVDGIEYTLTVTADIACVKIAITGPVPEPAVAVDLSAINATTMAQPNAYISINGDAWSDATVGKYFFNKKGDAYVAVIPFDIPANATNGWKDTAYQAWGKIGVGDSVKVKFAEKQFNFASGKLDFSATNNIDFDNIVAGTKGVITVTATADECTCVATVF